MREILLLAWSVDYRSSHAGVGQAADHVLPRYQPQTYLSSDQVPLRRKVATALNANRGGADRWSAGRTPLSKHGLAEQGSTASLVEFR
jgi:hypothetical protein